jgi:putative ABC transport system substrate-binding protein
MVLEGSLCARSAELVALKPDALHAFSTPAAVALQQETRTIPIIFLAVSDPVGSGLVESLARPGGNATGWTNYVPTFPGKWLSLLKEIAPGIGRAAALFNPITAPYATKFYIPALQSAGRAVAVEVTPAVVREPTNIETTVSEFAREPGGRLIVIPDTFVHRGLIIALANQNRLPTIYPYRYVGPAGGLVTYGYNEIEPYPSSAEYVDRILKGANPGDLPVQAPTKFELVINLKTARALGLAVPPTLLALADEVIE